MSEKILGYILIAVGVCVIIASAANVYSVFSGKARPIAPFNLGGISLDFGAMAPPEQKATLDASGASLKTELIKPEVLNQPLNYAAHLLLMGFLASAGFKLASLGTMLVRPIKVKLSEET
jgi:hypothetical protein